MGTASGELLQYLILMIHQILKFRTVKRTFRLTTSSTNTLTGDVFTSAETDYTAKGLVQQVQETVSFN